MSVEKRNESGARRTLGWLALASAVVVLVAGPLGWVVTDRLEQRNDFCNACHLPNGAPLHAGLRRAFDAAPPVDLASAHAVAAREQGDAPFRCFDCHQGTGFLGRAQVKLLAAKDAFWYLTGRFEEPTQMRYPLEDADCAKCHPSYPESEARAAGAEGWSRPFHAIAVHNADFALSCVECHQAHERGGIPAAYFLRADALIKTCARCHSELAP